MKERLWSLGQWRQMKSTSALLLMLAISILCGCSISQGVAPVASPTSRPPIIVTPTDASESVSFVSQDGVNLSGVLYGRGTRAIILANEGDNDSSRWLPVAQRLAQQGYLVLSFNYRYQGNSIDQLAVHSLTDLHAAIAFMRARGVSRLALIGASLGALDTVKVASAEKFDAIVVISAPMGFSGGTASG